MVTIWCIWCSFRVLEMYGTDVANWSWAIKNPIIGYSKKGKEKMPILGFQSVTVVVERMHEVSIKHEAL